ncbi:MAG: HAMP domain-containing sensor histidine kinase [Flavitalea sp.]
MKLLTRTIYSYLVYAIIIVSIAIPIFYFVIQEIVYEEADESLIAQKEETADEIKNAKGALTTAELSAYGISKVDIKPSDCSDYFYNTKIFDKISGENIPYRFLEGYLNQGKQNYKVLIRRSLIDREELIKSILIVMIILLVLIIIGSSIINRQISKNIWKPFYNTINQLHSYTLASNQIPSFEKTEIDEFKVLNQSLSTLIDHNLHTFRSQKEFTENAAHEMQTPLAILQGKLELLMQTDPTSKQAALMSDLADASQRMNRLNSSLLLISTIENNASIKKEPVVLNETIQKTVTQFAFASIEKNISIVFSPENILMLDGDTTLIEILLTNLISNAIRYTPKSGLIKILIKGNSEFIISNTAVKGPLDASRIFQRFQKDEADSKSIGLGLSIAEKICTVSNYALKYSFENEMHSFSVNFKI